MKVSRHAGDQMFKRRVSTALLEETINKGIEIPGRYAGTIYYKYQELCVVVDAANKIVVTVFWEKTETYGGNHYEGNQLSAC